MLADFGQASGVERAAVERFVRATYAPIVGDVSWDHDRRTLRLADRPYFRQQLALDGAGGVVPDGAPWNDLSPLRDLFARHAGGAVPPMGHLIAALAQQTFRGLAFRDAPTQALVGRRPVIFVANHQVITETPVFSKVIAPFLPAPPLAIANRTVAFSWFALAEDVATTYPGNTFPSSLRTIEKNDPTDVERGLREALAEGRSIVIHVEGHLALSCRTPVKRLSSRIVELAIEHDIPLVPVKFVGAVPVEPLEIGLWFPVGFGEQEIVIGQAITPESLRQANLRERRDRVVAAINELAPSDGAEEPFPGKPAFAEAVANRVRQGRGLMSSVIAESLARHDPRDGFDLAPIRAIVSGAEEPRYDHQLWNGTFRVLLLW